MGGSDLPIDQALPNPSVRTRNCLRSVAVRTLSQLTDLRPSDLLQIKNFGRISLTEIEARLKEIGLSLRTTGSIPTEPPSSPSVALQLPLPIHASDETAIARAKLKRLVRKFGGVDRLSLATGIRAMTFKTFLAEGELSQPSKAKIITLVQNPKMIELRLKERNDSADSQRIKAMYEMYKAGATLNAVGEHFKVSRERVRQLFKRGTVLGLFKYTRHLKPVLDRAFLLEEIQRLGGLKQIADAHSLHATRIQYMFRFHDITRSELRNARALFGKSQCIAQFQELTRQMGHPPTVTELQASRIGHSLYARLFRYWGSIDNFRKELDLPTPPPGNPNFHAVARAARARRKQLATIVRLQQMDAIKESIGKGSEVSLRDIAARCGMRLPRAGKLVNLLIDIGEVVPVGNGGLRRYRIANDQGD